MSEPITSDQLADLVSALDASYEERGWDSAAFFFYLARSDGEGADLGIKEVDGHPLDHLLGFTAPDHWDALGVACEGWAAPLDAPVRPSLHPDARRVRSVAVVTRDGPGASAVRIRGEELLVTDAGAGMVPDSLRRALRVPTAPPGGSVVPYAALLLLTAVVEARRRYDKPLSRSALRDLLHAVEPAVAGGGWPALRGAVARGRLRHAVITPDVARWMDDGIFQRWLHGDLAGYRDVAAEAKTALSAAAYEDVLDALEAWTSRPAA